MLRKELLHASGYLRQRFGLQYKLLNCSVPSCISQLKLSLALTGASDELRVQQPYPPTFFSS